MTMDANKIIEKIENDHIGITSPDRLWIRRYAVIEAMEEYAASTARQAFIEGGTEVFLKWVDRSPLDSQIDSLKIFLSTKYDELHKEK